MSGLQLGGAEFHIIQLQVNCEGPISSILTAFMSAFFSQFLREVVKFAHSGYRFFHCSFNSVSFYFIYLETK